MQLGRENRMCSVHFTRPGSTQGHVNGSEGYFSSKLSTKWEIDQRGRAKFRRPEKHLQDKMKTKFRVRQDHLQDQMLRARSILKTRYRVPQDQMITKFRLLQDCLQDLVPDCLQSRLFTGPGAWTAGPFKKLKILQEWGTFRRQIAGTGQVILDRCANSFLQMSQLGW